MEEIKIGDVVCVPESYRASEEFTYVGVLTSGYAGLRDGRGTVYSASLEDCKFVRRAQDNLARALFDTDFDVMNFVRQKAEGLDRYLKVLDIAWERNELGKREFYERRVKEAREHMK